MDFTHSTHIFWSLDAPGPMTHSMILFRCISLHLLPFSSESWPKKTKPLNVNKNDFGAYLTRSDDSFDATFTSPVDAIIDFTILRFQVFDFLCFLIKDFFLASSSKNSQQCPAFVNSVTSIFDKNKKSHELMKLTRLL